ncbi:MAG: hypothetical protein LBG19_04225 [Prevotellaceae bacterium]|jgi:predicted membrane protein|nr:hypothetical protein [Prevotellaceae bacterium]
MSKKLTNIISIALMLIGAAFGIYTWVSAGQAEGVDAEMAAVNPLFIWTYVLVAIAVLALLIVPLPYMIKNPGTMKKFGIGVLALGVVILIVYLMASDESLPFLEDAASKNEWSKWADVNILAMYVMTGIAILAIAYSSIRGMLKK